MHKYIWSPSCVYAYAYMHIYIYIYIYIHIDRYACLSVCMHVCMYAAKGVFDFDLAWHAVYNASGYVSRRYRKREIISIAVSSLIDMVQSSTELLLSSKQHHPPTHGVSAGTGFVSSSAAKGGFATNTLTQMSDLLSNNLGILGSH